MQRLLYIIIYPFVWLISILPMWLLYAKSNFLYFMIYYVIGYRKRVVKDNLRLIFPEKSDSERNLIAKKFYQHFCDLIFETIKSLSISEKEIMKRFEVTNNELLDVYYQKNKSILVMGSHYANWEWSCMLNKLMPYQAYGVYKALDNKYFDALVKKIRERFGAIAVNNKKIISLLYRKSLEKTNTLTYILSDQTPKASDLRPKDTFMGIEVPVFTGTEELAKKLDFAVLYLKTEKVKRGYYRATYVVVSDTPRELEDYQITRLFLTEIEKQIQENPHIYLWSHKRWKHRSLASSS